MAVPRFGQYLPARQPSPLLGGIQAATGILGQLSGIEAREAQTELGRMQEERLREQLQANIEAQRVQADIRRTQEERLAQQMRAEEELRPLQRRRLQQQIEAEAGMTPLRRQMLEAQIKKLTTGLEHPELSLAGLPPITRQRAYVESIKQRYGTDSEQAQQAQKDLDLTVHNLESQMHYRQSLAEALPRRVLTTPSKAMVEREAIARGLSPTGRPLEFLDEAPTVTPIEPEVEGTPLGTPTLENKVAKMTPEQLKKAQEAPFGSEDSATLSLYLSKQAGLGDNTKKLTYGSVLEKTIDLMTPYRTAMAYYSGVGGKAQYARDVALSQTTGRLTPQLKDFTRFVEMATSTLVPQITQYYGVSITEHQQRLLRDVANPANWEKSPERALIAFDTLINTLENEIQVRRDLVKKPSFLTKKHAKTAPMADLVEKTGYSLNELVKAADANNIPVTQLIERINELKGGA
jgi:hypothetical protein